MEGVLALALVAQGAVTPVSLSFGTTSSFLPVSFRSHFLPYRTTKMSSSSIEAQLRPIPSVFLNSSSTYASPEYTDGHHATPTLAEDPSIGFRDVLRLRTSESHHQRHRLHISSNRLYFTHPSAKLEVSYPRRDFHWHAPAPSIPHRLYSTTRVQVRGNRRRTTALMKMTSNTRVKPELSSFSPEWTNKRTNE